ncbi:hypothetical protein [Dokdonella fugitiva]|uniref:hypothetical protein n=1 Tax=Dokdonella fugitiva TaxID=328517 RepID=UPI00104CF75E|nr:hypothetical protein [Dokdonella fugitiva]MBA8884755.1 hypothetical protein [Dokdonella fugitiva]
MRLWKPFVVPTREALHEQNKATKRSFGIVKPDKGSVKLLGTKSPTRAIRPDARLSTVDAAHFDEDDGPRSKNEECQSPDRRDGRHTHELVGRIKSRSGGSGALAP